MIVFHPEAAAEFADATRWYAERASPAIARQFSAEIERTTSLVQLNPVLGSVWNGLARRMPVRRFPYLVIYRVAGADIQIIAIAHQRRRPDYWRKR